MSELRSQLEHGLVWSAQNDMSPLDGVERAAAKADAETQQEWAAEAFSLLEDEDVRLRTRAVAALDHLPVDSAALVQLLALKPRLFQVRAEGYPLHPEILEDALYKRIARDCAPEARSALRERVRVQPLLAVLLARKDAVWLVENASTAVHRDVLGGVLRALSPDQRKTLLANLGPWPDADAVLARGWWRNIPDADTLRAIVAAG